MFERVLLCLDRSEAGHDALRQGAELAVRLRAHVDLLLIVSEAASRAAVTAASVGHACVAEGENEFRSCLEQTLWRLKGRGIEAKGYLARGPAIEVIAQYAHELRTDLIVVSRYPQAEARWWTGGNRSGLADSVGCSVLIARRSG